MVENRDILAKQQLMEAEIAGAEDGMTESEKLTAQAEKALTPTKSKNKKKKKDLMHGTTSQGDPLTGAVFYTSGTTFTIRFDTLFKMNEFKVFNNFDMTAKRNFKNSAEIVLDTYNSFFLDEGGRLKSEPEYILTLQKILFANNRILTMREPIHLDTFINDYMGSIMSKKLIAAVSDYVDALYIASQDKNSEKMYNGERSAKKIDALRITDDHVRAILKISTLDQIMLPLISQYLLFNSSTAISDLYTLDYDEEFNPADLSNEIEKYNHVILRIFYSIFDKFDPTGDVKKHVFKIVESRILSRRFSDKGFWSISSNHGISPQSFTQEIFEKLVWNSIVKLSINRNYDSIVPFFQAIVNNSFDFLLGVHFRIKITTVNLNNKPEDDDDFDDSEYDKVEMSVMRRDEGMSVLRRLNIDDGMDIVSRRLGIEPRAVRLPYHGHVNEMQKKVLGMFMNKHLSDSSAIEYFTHEDYEKGLGILYQYLLNNNFKILPRLLIAECVTVKDKQNINGKKVKPQMLDSKLLQDILTKNYNSTKEVIQSPLFSTIATMYFNDFYDENENVVVDDNVKVENIAMEFLEFVKLVA